MSRDWEHGTVEITIVNKDADGNEIDRLHIVKDEEEVGEISGWENIIWTILTFMDFMPQTIEGFLSGKNYERRIFCKDIDDDYDDDYDDDDDVIVKEGDDED
jgi:hypothetical protein